MENFNPGFLKKKFNLQNTKEVESAAQRTELLSKARHDEELKKISQNPNERIQNYLDRFSEVLNRENEEDRAQGIEAMKHIMYKEYVVKPENIPEATFLLEQRIARQGGQGVEITENFKEAKTNQIINDQKHSLDRWVNYFSSLDSSDIPTWAKYWAFRSMLKMGKLEKQQEEEIEKETAVFKKRTKDTVAPFAPLNPLALRNTLSAITSKISKEEFENLSTKLDDEEYEKLLNTENFSKLYTQFLIELPEYSKEGLMETRGEWIKYNQGSSPDELVASLDGYPLEWCTANPDTAKTHLQGGDFYIYYSLNNTGEATIPRVAIRMEGDNISEVRGIAPDQNMDPYIGDVVKEKMDEFPDGEHYKKKSDDMKKMTELEERNEKGEELSTDDLRFLYQIDSKIEGFGYEDDPRIEEIIQGRDTRSDLSLVIGCSPEEISLIQEEALSGGIKYHYGGLNLGLSSVEGLILPEHIGGDLDIRRLSSAVGLKLPEHIGGNLYLCGLTSAEGLILPGHIGGDLDLDGLTSAVDLILPGHIGGYLDLGGLRLAEGLILPGHMGGNLSLNGLTSAEGLILPGHVGGNLYLRGLSSAEGLILPGYVGGNLSLGGLSSADKELLREKHPQHAEKI